MMPSLPSPPAPPGLARFSTVLDAYPAGFAGNRLNLLFLEDTRAISSPQGYLRQLDAPPLMEERREYVVSEGRFWPFPVLTVAERPEPWSLSQALFERFEDATRILPLQGDLARLLEQRVRETKPDVVALMIVDGLSYYDLPEDTDAQPLLVDGVTTTGYGFRRVVGRPSLSRRLFALGYRKQFGYTYFPPDPGTLADDLLATFSGSQVVRVKAFDEVLMHLRRRRLAGGYVQVSTEGLDQLSHAHREPPLRDVYLKDIVQRYDRLIDCLSRRGRHVLTCLTADHGILWREVLEQRVRVVQDLFPEDVRSARYLRGRFLRDYGRCVNCAGQNYTLLRVPYLTRNLRNNEWGVHGGISAWESVVPCLINEV